MIVADASAVLAIVLGEADAALYEDALAGAPGLVMSPVNYWEVLVRTRGEFGQAGVDHAQALMDRAEIVVVPADAELARAAAEAFARYKGRPCGKFNMVDCFAYALAQRKGGDLLYKGNDFTRTDIRNALARKD